MPSEPLPSPACYPNKASPLSDIFNVLANPLAPEPGNVFQRGWIPFIGWIAGLAVGLAYVVLPIIKWSAAFYAPHTNIPDIPLSAMWPPVLAILGAGTTRVASNYVRLREQRKANELVMKFCDNCPHNNCEDCPVERILGRARPFQSRDGVMSPGSSATFSPNGTAPESASK